NTSVELLRWIEGATGLGVIVQEPTPEHKKDAFRWRLRVDEMAPLLSAVKDDLVIKWEQAEILLEYLTTEWSMPLTEEQRSLREVMFGEMAELNRRVRQPSVQRANVQFAPRTRLKPLTDKQVGYIAGIIDGEGSINLCRNRRDVSLSPQV